MNTNRLTKVSTGHYVCATGEVRNVFDGSGAAHVRSARARWLVTFPGRFGKAESRIVPSLSVARSLLGIA